MSNSEVLYYIVLFTAQKQKKFKTWQDGTMKYYQSNKKLVLLDEKGYNIDRLFYKGRETPGVGDEFEFDRHLVTIESIEQTPVPSNTITAAINNISTMTTISPAQSIPNREMETPVNLSHSITPITPASASIRSRDSNRAPGLSRKRILNINKNNNGSNDLMDIDNVSSIEQTGEMTPTETLQPEVIMTPTPTVSIPSMHSIPNNLSDPTPLPQPVAKRFRVGLSKRLDNKMPHVNLHPETIATATASTTTSPIIKKSTSIRSFKPPLLNPQSAYSAPSAYPSSSSSSSAAAAAAAAAASFAPASTIQQQQQQQAEQESGQGISKPFKSPFAEGSYVPLVLQFPSKNKAVAIMVAKKHPKRTKVVPMKFSTTTLYQNTFQKIIHEHLEILLFNYSVYFYMTCEKFAKGKKDFELERIIRSKGLGMYTNCELIKESMYERRVKLRLKNREMHSKYSKDDIWVVSKNQMFDANFTFLARSTFYGPFSDGTLELDCLSPRDGRVAASLMTSRQNYVCALRTISASTEFMMLDTLEDRLDSVPLLPYIMGSNNRKGKKKQQEGQPILNVNDLQHIKLTRQDSIDVRAKLQDTIENYNLNQDQAKVLESVAKSVITSPGWNETTLEPITLVHGVYGSGKSFLAAVIIVFIQGIVELACEKREPEDHFTFKIIVSSMTNVAVDRILQTLLKLGYDQFVRIGSVKKIAKNILPYTARSKPSGNEELKELEQMLDEEQNSEEDAEHIAAAIQRFRKAENTANMNLFQVVGTTLASSVFDVFSGMRFPLCLIDESSQIMEPLSMVPITRFLCNRLIMIGDPHQLPPTITTTSEEAKVGQGLDKTMFNRLMEMGNEPIMLRTQYRCHPIISAVSNKLFYSSQLINGINQNDRKPLIEGLPTLLFIDVGGKEEKSFKTNSFWNDTEVALAAHLIQTLADNDISPSELGVISLYKEQADKISGFLGSSSSNVSGKNVQISTVDAFQGGEKEIIILSTVRTNENTFMTNRPRINVSLTRAKRHLIILGNKNVFSMNELWSRVMWDCQENCISGQDLGRFLNNLKLNHSAKVDL